MGREVWWNKGSERLDSPASEIFFSASGEGAGGDGGRANSWGSDANFSKKDKAEWEQGHRKRLQGGK